MSSSRKWCRLSQALAALLSVAVTAAAQAQNRTRNIELPEGGTILYGAVDGARSLGAAMSTVLRSVHENCRDRPKVGKIFRVRGSDSVATFFTVVNHPRGDKQVAGLLLASPSGAGGFEAAPISDEAARFRSTVNPMLNRLFSEWHPGGGAAAPKSAAPGRPVALPGMHRVVLADGSASLAIPDGWTFQGAGGTMGATGPRYETLTLNMWKQASNPTYGGAGANRGQIIYPFNADPVRGFPDILRQFWRLNGENIDLRVARVEPVPGPPSQRCVHGNGHMLIGRQGGADDEMPEMEALVCMSAPRSYGGYAVSISMSSIPPPVTDEQRATVAAIFSSLQVDERRVAVIAGQIAAPAIGAIRRIGQEAAARYAASDRANDAQHRAWENQQDAQGRRSQAFSNYLLDQTVLQDNNMDGHGTVGHGTAWNSTADALVRADPNRFEIVNAPGFWRGIDY
jgi:hypothetical protein